MRSKCRVDVREFGDTLPDSGEPGKRRFVAVVERRIGFARKSLQLVCAAQHPSGGFELLVLTAAQPGLVELGNLELQQIEARGFFALVHLKRVELRLQLLPRSECAADLLPRRDESRELGE